MTLPSSHNLPINLLSACFNKTSATYKFYWLLSILQSVETGKKVILKKELFARMISNAWFTVNYFHISFGKQDLIQDAVREIKRIEKISVDEKQETIYLKTMASIHPETNGLLKHFDKNVPHWFLSPWFPGKSQADIYALTKLFSNDCLYALHQDRIEINPAWIDYLILNTKVLKDFCYWNLCLYLQSKNPNVPDIANKLSKPPKRNSLTRQRNQFWDLVFNELGSVNCIYTGKALIEGQYAVEHFVPYSFVSHDLIWNLIPADNRFNISKGDKLPPLEMYFEPFYNLQKQGFDIVRRKSPNSKILEEYLTIFPDLSNGFSKDKFKETIQPLITIASNNGFEFM